MNRGVAETEIRSLDEKTRSAEFVIATQRGVDMGGGAPEHLIVKGVDLSRFAKNPMVLDAHDYWGGTRAVVGRSDMPHVEGSHLVARIYFADTVRGEEAWKLVRGGFLRTTSVGYVPHVTTIEEGKEWAGPDGFVVKGPARVAEKWKLYEISMAPLPADEDVCMRARGRKGEEIMADPIDQETVRKLPEAAPPPAERDIPEELRARIEKALVETIRAIAPPALMGLADRLVLEGKTLEEARSALLVAYAASMPPVGTPEVPGIAPPATPGAADRASEELKNVPAEALIRCLAGDN